MSLAATKEITHPNHRQRQFMQHLRGVGWIKARALPPNERTLESLLQRAGSNNSVKARKTRSSFG
jgi:hypothetical protein